MMFNASLRQLEIIGEASNRLSEELMNKKHIHSLGTNNWTPESCDTRVFWD